MVLKIFLYHDLRFLIFGEIIINFGYIDNITIKMKSLGRKIIIICFFLSILTLATAIAVLSAKIALTATGINLNSSNPNCKTTYANIKFRYTGTSLSISFGATIAIILFGSTLLVLMFNPFKKAWADRNIEDGLAGVRPSEIMVKY
mgnify:CR=1 FL=1